MRGLFYAYLTATQRDQRQQLPLTKNHCPNRPSSSPNPSDRQGPQDFDCCRCAEICRNSASNMQRCLPKCLPQTAVTKKPCKNRVLVLYLAESQGFEPWVPLRVQRISNPSRSTTPATLQVGAHDSSISAINGSSNPCYLVNFAGVIASIRKGVRPISGPLLHRLR